MPEFILATVALFLGRQGSSGGHRARRYARQDAQPGRHPPPAGVPQARSVLPSRRPGVDPAALRKQRLELLLGLGTTHLQLFYSPLFTRVRGREVLRTSP